MTIKRLILIVLTVLAIARLGFSLFDSWSEPQIQSRLELYQTNLLLHAAEWKGEKAGLSATVAVSDSNLKTAREALLGSNPYKTAQEQYDEVRQSALNTRKLTQEQLQQLRSQLATPPDTLKPKSQISPFTKLFPATPTQLQASVKQFNQLTKQIDVLVDELDVRLGILQAQQGETKAALKTWQNLVEAKDEETPKILIGLWSNPPRLLPNAEEQIQQDLDSWFRYRALSQVYELQKRPDALAARQAKEQNIAQQSVVKLAIVGGIPIFGCLIGVGLVIFLVGGLLLQGKRSLLVQNAELRWTTPWDGETILQVMVVGFFFVSQILGQLLLPLLFAIFKVNPASFDIREKAFSVLLSYLLMSLLGILVLYISIKPFFPLPEGWFKFKSSLAWVLWGLGGYFVALPLVIVVSLVNQKLWQGQGGSNPILPIALEGRDGIALSIFFLTAAVAAPLFEETLFRGFLLPSLTRYLPVWGAIAASSFLFAIAHLSLSEVLPLMTLGIVLGIVYTRSRSLLAPMLLHSLWNSGTLLSLFILGSGSV